MVNNTFWSRLCKDEARHDGTTGTEGTEGTDEPYELLLFLLLFG